MEVLTTRDKIETVAERWKQTYCQGNTWYPHLRRDKSTEEIYNQLKALPFDATAEQVAAIIGNDSWTRITCDSCGEEVDVVVQIGQEPACESATALVCQDCLSSALRLAVAYST